MKDPLKLTVDNIQVIVCKQALAWPRDRFCDPDLKDYDARYLAHSKESAAHAAVGELLASGAIRFELHPLDERTLTRRLEGRMAVVNPDFVQTLEDRIRERADTLLNEAIEDAFHEIDRWGSHYSVTTIRKDDAKRLLREGLRRVMARKTTEVSAELVASADGGR